MHFRFFIPRMPELDFGNIYSSSGKIIQLRYAQKATDSGSTILAMKSSCGAVLISSKPRTSNLCIQEADQRIKKISSNAYMLYTGILTDGYLIHSLCKRAVRNYKSNYDTEINAEYIKKILSNYLYMFTSHLSLRIVGSSFLTIVKDVDDYKILLGEPSGKVSKWNACAAGAGERRAFTELEKLSYEGMSISDMLDQGIKILYKCFDPLNDIPFDIEAGYISDDSNGEFVRVDGKDTARIAEKYKNISIDSDGE